MLYSSTFTKKNRDYHWRSFGHMALTKFKCCWFHMTSSNIQTKELRYSWVEVSEQLNSWLKTTNQPTKKYSEKFSIRKGSSFWIYLFVFSQVHQDSRENETNFFPSGTDINCIISSTQERLWRREFVIYWPSLFSFSVSKGKIAYSSAWKSSKARTLLIQKTFFAWLQHAFLKGCKN